MDDLSVDLICKILIRIPLKSLLKLRCVSKLWCNIIDDPLFAHMQYDSSEVEPRRTLLLGITDDYTEWRVNLTLYAACDNEETRVIHAAKIPIATFEFGRSYDCCNGLMYFVTDKKIVVLNPLRSTHFRVLPPLPISDAWDLDSTAIGLGFDSLTKTFKMVCINYRPSSSTCTLVHTLGTTSWREVSGLPAYCDRYDNTSVFVQGFLHWMTRPSVIQYREGRILAFDVSKETFKVIPHPEIDFEGQFAWQIRILDIKGNLAMLDQPCGGKIDIWVLDYEKQLWSKKYTIDINTICGQSYNLCYYLGLWKDELLFNSYFPHHPFKKYWTYSLKTGDSKVCDIQGSHAIIYSLRGSLISIRGAM